MKIAVCDDDAVIIEEIKELVVAWAFAHNYRELSLETFSSAEGLLLSIEDTAGFDAYFLDLELPKMNGYDLAKEIRKEDRKVPIVFITNSDDYLLQGYEIELCRYIKKPIRKEILFEALDRCYEKYEEQLDTSFLIRLGKTSMKMDFRDLFYVMSEGHNVVYVFDGKPPLRCPIYTSFESFTHDFPPEFLRCHRGYIINLRHVYSYNANRILMTTKEEIPIGKLYRETAVRSLQEWFLTHVLF